MAKRSCMELPKDQLEIELSKDRLENIIGFTEDKTGIRADAFLAYRCLDRVETIVPGKDYEVPYIEYLAEPFLIKKIPEFEQCWEGICNAILEGSKGIRARLIKQDDGAKIGVPQDYSSFAKIKDRHQVYYGQYSFVVYNPALYVQHRNKLFRYGAKFINSYMENSKIDTVEGFYDEFMTRVWSIITSASLTGAKSRATRA
ncbi:hypothetical protein JXB31_00065 [Candidatus Woesearchaeota archaeon]|nr:hypothetical protein [Candidatus Woesearchaeota archaeon]